MAAMSGAWLRKKVHHPWLGGARRLTMYLATLDCAISNPSLSSSPWMRGAPPDKRAQLGVDLRSSSLRARLPTPVAAKTGPVPSHERLGPDDCENLQDRWKPAIQLDKEPAIIVREPDVTTLGRAPTEGDQPKAHLDNSGGLHHERYHRKPGQHRR